jgi:hypothetical protein
MRILLLVMLLVVLPRTGLAQISESSLAGLSENETTLVLSPSYPGPMEQYTVTLNDYSSSLSGAEVTWYRNNSLIPEAINQRSITLTAPASGDRDTLKVTLKNESDSVTLTSVIEPLYLDIIVEPQTHVPSFYVGRARGSIGSTVNLTALVNGTAVGASQYIYTWRINNTVLEAGPLRGRNEISFVVPQSGGGSSISLLVTNLNGLPLARRALFIPTTKPKLVFYEVSTLYGIEAKALTRDFALIGNSATLRAEPYFLSSTVFNAPNIITWSVADEDIGVLSDNPYEVTLQKTGFSGKTNIGFHVRSTDILLQGARRTISVSI